MLRPIKTKKVCSIDNCNQPHFARGYCNYHYKIHYLLKKEPKKPKESYKIPYRTKKRQKDECLYRENRLLFIEAKKAEHIKGHIFCIFCGNRIKEEPSLHHADGRDDAKLLDESKWYLSHNFCHVFQYHSMSWELIWWWNDYLNRIKELDVSIYEKELLRMEK